MTAPAAPAPVPPPEQATAPPAPDPAAAPAPAEGGNDTWPPDPQTLIQMMMDARFSIIDEPAGDVAQGADRQVPPAGATPPPQPPAQG